jgi:2-polyprenyl-3-methyl-5-hydroxy-6-metoxy-1,4-benzoquinol methylase
MNQPPDDLKHLSDEEINLQWNKATWGDINQWKDVLRYGYYWPGGTNQKNNIVTQVAEKYLHPHLGGRRDLKIMELAPGGGRFTTELIRLSREMHLVDYSESCIEVCRERFKYFPDVKFYVNDGKSVDVVPDSDFDLIASWDSMVHVATSILEKYVASFIPKLVKGGIIWIDHSGKGVYAPGSRSDMTKEKMASIAEAHGLFVAAQYFRSAIDCVSVLVKT